MRGEGLIFEKALAGKVGWGAPADQLPELELSELLPEEWRRDEEPKLAELSEPEVVRHYTRLSQLNFCVDTNFYPLGSCTMKYNPRVNERVVGFDGFKRAHPELPVEQLQGVLKLCYELGELLKALTGLHGVSLQPAAGAHGELTALLMLSAFFRRQGETREVVVIPDSAHGTNPASAARAGFRVVKVPSNQRGRVDLEKLSGLVDEKTACLMLTNPNTLGLFEEQVCEIADLLHSRGAFLYLDGANFNAFVGRVLPRDMGVDIIHVNLHKTFSTPHGGGGPGSGPIVVEKKLMEFLPVPVVVHEPEVPHYRLEYERPLSIGRVRSFLGQLPVLIKAYGYIRVMGIEGLRQASADAVLNANYLCERLKNRFQLPYGEQCMHEFVLSARDFKREGINALDIAKKLLDYGFHPPTVYFPLIVEEALMVEPTETENKATLDAFVDALEEIVAMVTEKPEELKRAPQHLPVSRLDEYQAARYPCLGWEPPEE